MADSTDSPTLQRLDYDFSQLTGSSYTDPLRAGNPKAGENFWLSTRNCAQRDGMLTPRPRFMAADEANSGAFYGINSVTGSNSDNLCMAVYQHRLANNYPEAGTAGQPNDNVLTVLITDSAIRLHHPSNQATWMDCAVQYPTGTDIVEQVSCTLGSPNISTVGGTTLWQTHNIVANCTSITINGVVYGISAITGESSLTLSSNFTSANGNYAYTMRRYMYGSTWGSASFIYNGNLYVASSGAGGQSRLAGVLRVNNVEGLASGITTEWLASSFLAGAGRSVVNFGRIAGARPLMDGRIVVAGSANFNAGNAQSVVFYSSHLDQRVWSAPGGYTVLVQDMGPMMGMGMVNGGILTFHGPKGIVLGQQTGQDAEPLAFQLSGAAKGTALGFSLQQFSGGEIYVADDLTIRVFNGSSDEIVDDQFAYWIRKTYGATSHPYKRLYWLRLSLQSWIDEKRGEYGLIFAAGPNYTAYVFNYRNGLRSTWDVPFKAGGGTGATFIGGPKIYGAGYGPGGATAYSTDVRMWADGREERGERLTYSTNSGVDFTATYMVGALTWVDRASDQAGYYTISDDVVSATSRLLDCDMPDVEKTVDHITLWMTRHIGYPDTYTSANCSVTINLLKRDGTTAGTQTATCSLNSREERQFQFFFAPIALEAFTVQISIAAQTEKPRISRMAIHFFPLHNSEAINPAYA